MERDPIGRLISVKGTLVNYAFVVERLEQLGQALSEPCPWDCGNFNGQVDTADFLALLGQWGQVGTSCDFDGNGVDTSDFLDVLGFWGPCP